MTEKSKNCLNFNDGDKKNIFKQVNNQKIIIKFLNKLVNPGCHNDIELAQEILEKIPNTIAVTKDIADIKNKLLRIIGNEQAVHSSFILKFQKENIKFQKENIDDFTVESIKYLIKNDLQNDDVNKFCLFLSKKIQNKIPSSLSSNKHFAELLPACAIFYKSKSLEKDKQVTNMVIENLLIFTWKAYNDHYALFELAHGYHYGIGVQQDLLKAKDLYLKIRNVNDDAKYHLVQINLSQGKDQEESTKMLNDLSETEHENAMCLKAILLREGKFYEQSIDDSNEILQKLINKDNPCGKFYFSYNIVKDKTYDLNDITEWEMLESVSNIYLDAHIELLNKLVYDTNQILENCINDKSSLGGSSHKIINPQKVLQNFEKLLEKEYIKENKEIYNLLVQTDYKSDNQDTKKLLKLLSFHTHPDKLPAGYGEEDFRTVQLYKEHLKKGDLKQEGVSSTSWWKFWSWDTGIRAKHEKPSEIQCDVAQSFRDKIIEKISQDVSKMSDGIYDKAKYYEHIAILSKESIVFEGVVKFDRQEQFEKYMHKAIEAGGGGEIKHSLALHYLELGNRKGVDSALEVIIKFTESELQKSACSTFLKESIEILLKKHNHNNVDLHLYFPANCIKESEYFAKIYSGLMMIKDLSVEVDYDYACRYYETAFDPDEICTNRDKQLYDQMSNYQKTLCGKEQCELYTEEL